MRTGLVHLCHAGLVRPLERTLLRHDLSEVLCARQQRQRLAQIAWSDAAAQEAHEVIARHTPTWYAVRRRFSDLGLLTFGFLAAMTFPFLVALASQDRTVPLLILGVSLIAVEVVLLGGTLYAEERWAAQDAVQVACVRAAAVLACADVLAATPGIAGKERTRLARTIDRAAGSLLPRRFVGRHPGVPRRRVRQSRRTVEAASNAVRTYGTTALIGNPAALRRMSDDFGRIVLRLVAGRLDEVAQLGPEGQGDRRAAWLWTVPWKEIVAATVTALGAVVLKAITG